MANEWKEAAFEKAFPAGSLRIAEYNYEYDDEGSGGAIAFNPATGKYLVAEYSHCSCYGPEESMSMRGEYDDLIDAFSGCTGNAELLKELVISRISPAA